MRKRVGPTETRNGAESQPLALAVSGATGRVGRRVALLAAADPALRLAAALASADNPGLGSDLGTVLGDGEGGRPLGVSVERDLALPFDVLVDLSVPGRSAALATRCATLGRPLVIGTTGQTPAELREIEEASARIAIVLAPNLSPGVAVLMELAAEARARLGPDYDVEIVETHRKGKLDAPSGTALALARRLESLGLSGATEPTGAEPTVPIHSLRAGEIAGTHALLFAGPGETLLLRHCATDRDLFARGALRAARWLIGRAPGLFGMADVLAPQT